MLGRQGQPPDSVPDWLTREAELIGAFSVKPGAAAWPGERRTDTASYASRDIPISPWVIRRGGRSPRSTPIGVPQQNLPSRRDRCFHHPRAISRATSSTRRTGIVVGRDIHQHSFAKEAVDRLRSAHA